MQPCQRRILNESVAHDTVFRQLIWSNYLQVLHLIKHIKLTIVKVYGDGFNQIHAKGRLKDLLLLLLN